MSIFEIKAFHAKNDITDFLSKTSKNQKSQNIAIKLFQFMKDSSMKSYDQFLMENPSPTILGLNAATKLQREFLFPIAKENKEKILRGEMLDNISEYKEELLKDSMKYLKPNSVNRTRKRI